MEPRSPTWRRELSRKLSRQLALDVDEILAEGRPAAGRAQRIGITGPPGAGKSSAIAELARRRMAKGREVAVLAIDPTSPISRGSLLGDRIRMDSVAEDDRLFIRSVPSGICHDGLCQNVVGLLDTLDRTGFDDLILETVGVGQVSYEARKLVDTLVLLLVPESGDTVQAMKAGALEMADIYVVNKADLPAASRVAAELRSVFHLRRATGWQPTIIEASALTGVGLDELEETIDRHYAEALTPSRREILRKERRAYQLRALIHQKLEAFLAHNEQAHLGGDLQAAYCAIVAELSSSGTKNQTQVGALDVRRHANS